MTLVLRSSTPAIGRELASLTRQSASASTGCCGGDAPAGSGACCALDADVKSSGGAGCGCSATSASRDASATPRASGGGCC